MLMHILRDRYNEKLLISRSKAILYELRNRTIWSHEVLSTSSIALIARVSFYRSTRRDLEKFKEGLERRAELLSLSVGYSTPELTDGMVVLQIRFERLEPQGRTASQPKNETGRPVPVKAHVLFGFVRMSANYREVVIGECEEKFHFVLNELEGSKHAIRWANAAYIAVVLQTTMLYLLNGAKSWIIGILVGIPLYKKIFGGD